jgi:hypothetical protein
MKICKRCDQEFDEDENSYDNPAEVLADIFLGGAGAENSRDLCPQCRQELGLENIRGFGQ